MKDCFFCKSKTLPTFKESETLKKFLSPRGKIFPKEKTRICSWHQRKLASEIKLARILILLPFVTYES